MGACIPSPWGVMEPRAGQGRSLPSLTSSCPSCRSGLSPGSDQALRTPFLPARTMTSSPRSHNVRAAWCGRPWARPSFSPEEAGGRAALGPAPCFRAGAFSLHCVCLSFPGAPLPGKGPCMSGGPQPPKPSVCLSVFCYLFKTWCPDPRAHRECQRTNPPCPPRHTHTWVYPSVRHTPRLADPPTAAAVNTRINTVGLTLPRLLSSLGPGSWAGHPGSGCRQMSHPLWQPNGSL